ncbi:MAG: DUF11 domain-containing protein [Deltaproteobacteria bacterium]|nr:DUF11 domain-containing protein [Deltaproteobacteria bacterium]
MYGMMTTAAALCLALALPAWAQSESVTKSGVSGATPPGGSGTTTIDWTINYGLSSSGILPNMSLTDTWMSAQTLVAASVQTPGGVWASTSPNANEIDFSTALVAANAKGRIKAFQRPLSGGVLLQNTGDGFNPVLTDNGRVMGINHYPQPYIWCYDLNLGAACPGYPMLYPAPNTGCGTYSLAIGNRMYVNLDSQELGCGNQPGPDKIVCWDAATDSPCGESGPTGKSSVLAVANGKLFTLNESGELRCFDPANNLNACAGFAPRNLSMPAHGGTCGLNCADDLLTVGSKLYVANFESKLTCFDVSANTICAGWPSSPKNTKTMDPSHAARSNLFPRLSAGGAVTGVCVAGNLTSAACYNLDGSNSTEVPLGGVLYSTYPALTWNADVAVGSRVFFPDVGQNIGCFDWANQLPCGADGESFTHGFTSNAYNVYGLTTDGVTIFSYGDGATLQSWNPLTGVTPSDRAAAILSVDIDSFYCGTPPLSVAATWDKVVLSDVDLTPGVEFTSLMVSLTDTSNGTVVFGPVEAIGTSGSFDISSVSSSIRALRLEVDETPVNTVAWDDNVPPKASLTFTNGTPVQFCYETQVSCSGPAADYDNTISTTLDPHSTTATVTACAPSPYLTVSKSQPLPVLVPGQNSTYTITVTNNGNLAATTATVKDVLQVGVDLISAGGMGWSCTPSAATSPVGTVTCTFSGSIPDSGGTSTINITVSPLAAYGSQFVPDSSFTNFVAVDPAGGTNVPNPTNCSATDAPRAGCGAPVTSSIGQTPCSLLANGALCDDGIICNGTDSCLAGTCSGHSGSPCPETQCNTCQENADDAHRCLDASGTICDDGTTCTVNDQCDGAGQCVGQSYTANYTVLASNHVVLGQGTVAAAADPMTPISHVCGFDVDMKPFSQIQGDVVALRSTPASGTKFPALNFRKSNTVVQDCVTGGGWVKHPENATVSGGMCRRDMETEVSECAMAGCWATLQHTNWSALSVTPGMSLGSIRVRRGQTRRIPDTGTLGNDQIVIDTDGIRLDNNAHLKLAGTTSTTQVIVRVHGSLKLGRPAHVELEGLTPEKVIFVVDQNVSMHSEDTVEANVAASGDVRVGTASTIDGSLIAGGKVKLGNFVTVNRHPFVGW